MLGTFTFADIAMVPVLISVDMPASLKLGPAGRRGFVDLTLRARDADLLGWRDELYRAYRA